MTKSDVMVVAMSGPFFKRGAPALLDKWTRAEIALRNGAESSWKCRIGECAVRGSVRKAGIRLLQAMQCDAFAFGAEEGTAEDLISHSRFLREHEAEINRIFQTYRNDGRTYAAQLETAIAEILSHKVLLFPFQRPIISLDWRMSKKMNNSPNRWKRPSCLGAVPDITTVKLSAKNLKWDRHLRMGAPPRKAKRRE